MRVIILFTLILSRLILAQNVQIYGEIKSMMKGNIKANYDLKDIDNVKNVYGLGAIENLKGEITVINSKPYISHVVDGKVAIDTTFNHKAALFAYGKINTWQTADTIKSELTIDKIDKHLSEIEKGSDPLTFIIKGEVNSLKWHVIDWATGDTVHTHKKHMTSGLHGELKNEEVIIIGFYSKDYKGILTHRDSNLHLHFINKNKTIAGHVDELVLKTGILKTGNI